MNHTAGTKGNYKILQKDLTALKAGKKKVADAMHFWYRHKFRLMSVDETFPLTIGILEFTWAVL